jgi:putative DNA primase/helicase
MDSVSSFFSSAIASRNKSLLNAADRDYLIQERKLARDWIYANCDSADIPRASLILGYEAKSPCIVFWSNDLKQQQLRPHTPWASKDGKCPKYRTPIGEYDAFLARHPKIEGYWTDLEALKARCFTIGGKPYLLITEGCIKGITGCQFGIPTIALV